MRIKIAALLLVFTLMFCVFAACKRDKVNGIAVVDNEGTSRVLATNDNGETMTDDAGNLIIVVTNADGKEETQRVAPPDYYVKGNIIETPKYTVTIPKGWEQSTGLGDVRLIHTDTKSELNLVTLIGKTLEDGLASAEEVMGLMRNEGGTVETAQTTICGVEATKYSISKSDSGAVTFYIFEKNGTVYSFYSVAAGENGESIDFETLINSIQFK